MRLNRNELKKIQYDFNSYSNRLLQANYQDYTDVLGKCINFIKSTPIIFDYISDCGQCDLDLATEIEEVRSSGGRMIFSIGDTEEEEIRNVYAVLQYIVENSLIVYQGIAWGYSSSSQYQDKIKGFNERFVMVLIRHIERYLTKVGIDMGLDDKITYNVTVHEGLSIIASDNATVTATNNVGTDVNELSKLITAVKETSGELPVEDQESVFDSLEVIENEALSDKPKKGMLRTAIVTLKSIKGVAEFSAAIVALAEFVVPLIG